MNLAEYEKVKNFSYLEYCNYLQKKYGMGLCNYLTESWEVNLKIYRTNEGLIAHHKYEDHELMSFENCDDMSINIENAKRNPYEWQSANNIIYCDYLEHLFLHVLIFETPLQPRHYRDSVIWDNAMEEILWEDRFWDVGYAGVCNYIIPELNDIYSGDKSDEPWKSNCYSLIINDKQVYLRLIKRFKEDCKKEYVYFEVRDLCRSNYNQIKKNSSKNKIIYEEIIKI